MLDLLKKMLSWNEAGKVIKLPRCLEPYGNSIRVSQEELITIARHYNTPIERTIQILEKELYDLETIFKRYVDTDITANKIRLNIEAYLRDTCGGLSTTNNERDKELEANYQKSSKDYRSLDGRLKEMEDDIEQRSVKLLPLGQEVLNIYNKSVIGRYLQKKSQGMNGFVEACRKNKKSYREAAKEVDGLNSQKTL